MIRIFFFIVFTVMVCHSALFVPTYSRSGSFEYSTLMIAQTYSNNICPGKRSDKLFNAYKQIKQAYDYVEWINLGSYRVFQKTNSIDEIRKYQSYLIPLLINQTKISCQNQLSSLTEQEIATITSFNYALKINYRVQGDQQYYSKFRNSK